MQEVTLLSGQKKANIRTRFLSQIGTPTMHCASWA